MAVEKGRYPRSKFGKFLMAVKGTVSKKQVWEVFNGCERDGV